MINMAHIGLRRLTSNIESNKPILLVLKQPMITPGYDDWECTFQILKEDTQALLFEDKGYGIDSLQALIDAIEGIHHALKKHFSEYEWLLQNGNSGVPRMTPIHLPASYTEKIMRCIDTQLAAFLQDVSQNKKD